MEACVLHCIANIFLPFAFQFFWYKFCNFRVDSSSGNRKISDSWGIKAAAEEKHQVRGFRKDFPPCWSISTEKSFSTRGLCGQLRGFGLADVVLSSTSLIATNAAIGQSRGNREIKTDHSRSARNSSSIRLRILIVTLVEFFRF